VDARAVGETKTLQGPLPTTRFGSSREASAPRSTRRGGNDRPASGSF
jgi:hypothetical protein